MPLKRWIMEIHKTFRIEEGVEKIDSKYWTLNKKKALNTTHQLLPWFWPWDQQWSSFHHWKDKSGLVQVVTTQQSVIRFDIHAAPGSKEEIKIYDLITESILSHASTTCDESGCLVVTPKFCHSMGSSMHGAGMKGGMKKNGMNGQWTQPKWNERTGKSFFKNDSELRKIKFNILKI